MKKLLALTLFSLLLWSSVVGQYEDRYWIMGRTNSPGNTTNVNFDFFPTGLALYDTDQAPPGMSPPPDNITNNNGFEGWGVVTNPETGELFFYTDGEKVYDEDHQDITPTGGLGANASSSQAVAVAVNPICPFDQYYIFSNPTGVFNGSTSGPVTYRTYTIGGGFSAITPLPGPNGSLPVGEGMVVIPSRTDPFTSWLIVRLLAPSPNGSDYVVYRIDETGIAFEATYNFGPAVTDNPYSPIMNMTYVNDPGSANGVIVGFSVSGTPNRVFINSFNTTTGAFLGSGTTLATFSGGTLYDLEFSPGGNFVYYASYNPSSLYQVSLLGGQPELLRNFGQFRAGGLKRAPDGYIYHVYDAGEPNATTRVRLGRIVQPETAFNGSNFDEMYQADFNSSISMIYEDVFSYNFPEFAGVPSWSVDLSVEGGNFLCPGSIATITATINSLGEEIDEYRWTQDGTLLPGNDNPVLETEEAGTYQVTVNLVGGCSIVSDPISITEAPNPPEITDIATVATVCGEALGAITITATGGNGVLMYSIDGETFSTTNTFQNLSAGLYSVSVRDEQGCSVSFTVEVTQSEPAPMINSISVQEASCQNNDGALTIFASGGLGTLAYSIDGADFQAGNSFVGLAAGSYLLVVQDENQCVTTLNAVVPGLDNGPQIDSVTTTVVSCQGDDGSLNIFASGENGGLTYSLSDLNFQGSNEFLDLTPDSYTVVVQDNLGCTDSVDVLIEEVAVFPVVEAISTELPDCNQSNGTVHVNASGGTGALTYTLDGINFQETGTFSGLIPGTYTLSLRDALGCTTDSTFLLLEGNCPVYVPNAFSPNRDGVNDRFQVFSNGDPATRIQRYLIFDRWGGLVYEANDFLPADQNQFWDGTSAGRLLGPGVYAYLIEVSYADGTVQTLNGDVALVR